MLQTKKGKVTLAIVGGFLICWFLYHNLGIDDLVEKNKIYTRAEESFSDGDYYLAANRFKIIPGFRDSDQQLKEIYAIVAKDCTEFLTQSNMVKAKQGRIRKIKTLMVKDGFVWGEPDVFTYAVGQ
ncbi:hypothetical protein [Peribacillus frigoritolerans]|uniref:hypothetical protein n=1 Tax=Peribacillus frigoritolerans TaxID=450367 RepID=UPI001059AA08|nr:hypothetical protein [Peribacillus frigoritolerans]TDL82084.1 hypothetical protein E2R53_00390 [Peribacillus frigoritolerans]